MAVEKGITIKFRGVEDTSLKSAINKIRNEAKSLDKELGYVNKALKFDPTNVKLWSQKQKMLTEEVEASKERLKELKDAQAQLDSNKVNRNSAEYRELEREIIKCENQQKNYNKELNAIPSARLKAVSEGFKKVGASMTKFGKEMTTKVTAPIVAAYTLSADLGSDYEENLNKIDVAFGQSSEEVKNWANNVREQFGLSKVQATQAVSSFGALGKGIGLTEGQAAEMSMTLAGLSADLGSYFNVGTDESSKALEGIFTGEAEALKKFGVVMNETNLKKFAEDQGLVYSELDQTEKTMLRYQYVLAKTTDAQGDFERTNDGTANSTKIFKAALQDLGTAIGTQLLPIITPIIQKIADLVSKFADLPEPAQKVITIVGLVVAAIGPLLLILGSLASAIGSLMTVVPMLGTAIAGLSAPILPIIAGIAGLIAIGVALYQNWDTIKEYASIVASWVVEKWTALKDGVVNAVTSLKEKVLFYWEALKLGISVIAEGIKTAITNPIQTAVNFIKNAVDKIKGFFSGLKIELPHIKLPHFNLTGSFSIVPPSVPKLSIDWYKNGGIFTNPTIFPSSGVGVGEAGAEAVLPLKKLWEEMDKRFTNGVTININAPQGMDVNELAKEVERRLITATKRERMVWG